MVAFLACFKIHHFYTIHFASTPSKMKLSKNLDTAFNEHGYERGRSLIHIFVFFIRGLTTTVGRGAMTLAHGKSASVSWNRERHRRVAQGVESWPQLWRESRKDDLSLQDMNLRQPSHKLGGSPSHSTLKSLSWEFKNIRECRPQVSIWSRNQILGVKTPRPVFEIQHVCARRQSCLESAVHCCILFRVTW